MCVYVFIKTRGNPQVDDKSPEYFGLSKLTNLHESVNTEAQPKRLVSTPRDQSAPPPYYEDITRVATQHAPDNGSIPKNERNSLSTPLLLVKAHPFSLIHETKLSQSLLRNGTPRHAKFYPIKIKDEDKK